MSVGNLLKVDVEHDVLKMDRSRACKMVRSGLRKDAHYPKLRELAKEESPRGYFAAYIMSGTWPAAALHLAVELRKLLAGICRQVADQEASESFPTILERSRFARIGEWAKEIPLSPSDTKLRPFVETRGVSTASFMNAWLSTPDLTSELLEERCTLPWKMDDFGMMGGEHVGSYLTGSLVMLLHKTVVKVPAHRRVEFIDEFMQWTNGQIAFSLPWGQQTMLGVEYLLSLGIERDLTYLDPELLQRLAKYRPDAAKQLGRRRIPLRYPVDFRLSQAWISGVMESLTTKNMRFDINCAVLKEDPILLYAAFQCHGKKEVPDTCDVFGQAQNFATVLARTFETTGKPRMEIRMPEDDAVVKYISGLN